MQTALLDTDTLSEILKKKNPHVLRHASDYLAQHQRFSISAMTRYEVLRGLKDINALKQIQDFEIFCQHAEILPVSDAVFSRAADLWVEARRGGHPRYDADLIIAATAVEHGRVLVTGNTSHFAWVPNLMIDDWRQPSHAP